MFVCDSSLFSIFPGQHHFSQVTEKIYRQFKKIEKVINKVYMWAMKSLLPGPGGKYQFAEKVHHFPATLMPFYSVLQ
jgi:hypothetical protein